MGEVTEKIYCCDRGDNDNALAAAILAGNNRRDDWGPMAAMMGGGMNNWMNNPFAYLMFLAFTRNGFGNGNNAALEAIRTQMQDNQNSSLIMSALGDGFNRNDFALSQLAQNLNVDFNALQKCCCDVQAAIREVGGAVNFSAEKVINAANLGDCRIIEALNNCCCSTQRQIADFRPDLLLQNCKDTAELRNGQPLATVEYSTGTPILNGTAVFVPVTARVTVVTQGCGCKATAVSFPRVEINQKTGRSEMVVDVTVEANGKTATYAIPENLSVTYAGDIVLSTDKQGLTGEVEAMVASADQVIASVTHAQKIKDKAPAILADFNPVYREKARNRTALWQD